MVHRSILYMFYASAKDASPQSCPQKFLGIPSKILESQIVTAGFFMCKKTGDNSIATHFKKNMSNKDLVVLMY